MNGNEFVLHQQVAATYREQLVTRPLILTALTEQTCFWKDVRRILFNRATFRVLARVGQTGLLEEWSPIPLADVFGELAPDLPNILTGLGDIARMTTQANALTQRSASTDFSYAVHQRLVELLCAEANVCLTPAATAQVELVSAQYPIPLAAGADARFQALRATQEAVEQFIEQIEDCRASDLRLQAFEECRHMEAPVSIPAASCVQPADVPDRIMNVEVVAVYW